MKKAARNPIWLAIDTPDAKKAAELIKTVGPFVGGLKVGLDHGYRPPDHGCGQSC